MNLLKDEQSTLINQNTTKFGETGNMKNLINTITRVNFVARLADYTTYEFVAEEVYVEEADYDADLFRLFINHNDNDKLEVMVGNDSDYDIHEDVSEFFDLEAIKSICESTPDVEDITDEYIKSYQKRKNSGEDVGEIPKPAKLQDWIVLSAQGSTQSPNDRDVHNLQVLGFAKGRDIEAALQNFKQEYGFQMDSNDFTDVVIYPLANSEAVYKSLIEVEGQ